MDVDLNKQFQLGKLSGDPMSLIVELDRRARMIGEREGRLEVLQLVIELRFKIQGCYAPKERVILPDLRVSFCGACDVAFMGIVENLFQGNGMRSFLREQETEFDALTRPGLLMSKKLTRERRAELVSLEKSLNDAIAFMDPFTSLPWVCEGSNYTYLLCQYQILSRKVGYILTRVGKGERIHF